MRLSIALLFFSLLLAHGENLIHNSSFECGITGWTIYETAGATDFGDPAPPASQICASNSVHGVRSALLNSARMIGRPVWLTNGTYTFTFSAKSSSSGTMNADMMATWKLADSILLNPTPSFSTTTTAKRFTNTVTIATNDFYSPKFYSLTVTFTWIDAVQLEPGSSATAFAPGSVIEVGMDTADPNNNLFLADAKTLRCNLWNAGPQTNATVAYSILSSVWNTNIASGVISTNALSAFTNTTITLPLPTINGDMRIVAFVTNVPNSWTETSVAVFPYAPTSNVDTNGLLGIDGNWSPYHLSHYRRLGINWFRVFSQTAGARWVSVFPTLATTNFFPADSGIWTLDYIMPHIYSNGLVPMVCLATTDHAWRDETNASQAVMIADFTNYVGRMVHRYGPPPSNVRHWEVFNEPQQDPRPAIAIYDPAIYVNLLTNCAKQIKAIDPTMTVIGMGGMSLASHSSNVWILVNAADRPNIDWISFHDYPASSGDNDPNLTDHYLGQNSWNFEPQADYWRTNGNRALLNTETATGDIGCYHTIQTAFTYPFLWDHTGPWTSEAWFNELDARTLPAMDRITYNFLRTVGWGFHQFNFQYGRNFDDSAMNSGTPTIYQLNGTIKPWAVALLIANDFVKTAGLGHVPVTGTYWIEAYLHTNTLGVVMPIWCNDRGNRTLTITNGAMALYDSMRNLIQTNSTLIPITRSVRYLVSGSLTATQMWDTIANATWVTNNDTIPPGLTADMSPIGRTVVWGGVTNAFRAFAADATVMSYGWTGMSNNPTQTNVMYQWTLNDGITWSPWGTTNHFFYSWPVAGVYRVGWKAKDLANNESAVIYTPYFGDLAFEPSSRATTVNVSNLVVSGSINIYGWSFPLDSISTVAQGAYSVGRILTNGWSSALALLIRSSDNSTNYLVPVYDTNNIAEIVAWSGAGDVYVTNLFDQSGHGRTLSMTNILMLPKIVTNGVAVTQSGRTVMLFEVGAHRDVLAGAATLSLPVSHLLAVYSIDAANQPIITGANLGITNGTILSGASVGTRYALANGTNVNVLPFATGQWDVLTAVFDGVSSLAVDAGTPVTGAAGLNTITAFAIGSPDEGVHGTANMLFGDWVIFNSTLSAGDSMALRENINAFYHIY